MNLFLSFLIFFSIFFISLPISFSSITPKEKEKTALLEIKKSFNNPKLLSSWNPKTDFCNGWKGIECKSHLVAILIISLGKITGHIPVQIGEFTYLETLEFFDLPNLTGNIPRSITKLHDLRFLRIIHTNLSGPIPDYIRELKSLKSLELNSNQFTGPIPGWLSQMPKLEDINLSDNKLTGTIPKSFGYFAKRIPSLHLSNNKLSGKIPKSLSKQDFKMVELSRNEFIGDGSVFFGPNKTLERIDLSRNKFKFDLSKVKFPISLIYLDLSQNQIFGSLSSEMNKLRLEYFNVSYNRLCGKIPRGGIFQAVDPSVYSHNLCLCGPPLKAC